MKSLLVLWLALMLPLLSAQASVSRVTCTSDEGLSLEISEENNVRTVVIQEENKTLKISDLTETFYRYGVYFTGKDFMLLLSGEQSQKGYLSQLSFMLDGTEKKLTPFCKLIN